MDILTYVLAKKKGGGGGGSGSEVIVVPTLSSGTKIAEIEVDGNNNLIYAPTVEESSIDGQALVIGDTDPSGGGGSDVIVTPRQSVGQRIATITVDGDDYDIYSPAIAAEYDPAQTYYGGSIVLHNGKTYAYPINAETPVTGSWDPTKWIETTIGESTGELAGAVSYLVNGLSGLTTSKLDAPTTAGTAGQVLKLDSNLKPVWGTGGSGGSDVTVAPTFQSGTKIVSITVDGTNYDVYCPTIIDEFDSTIPYSRFSFVMHDGVIYMTPMERPAGEWNAQGWIPTSVGTMLSSQLNALYQLGVSVDAISFQIADLYNTSTSYNPGDYVLNNYALYKCKAATTGAWDSQKWQAISVTTALGGYATKADTVLDTTLSRGRKANTTVGQGSFAFGTDVEASGEASHAEGIATTASNMGTHAEGINTVANQMYAHAEGANTTASGFMSHAEGIFTEASGQSAHAQGTYTIAAGTDSHVFGRYNIADSFDSWPEWVSGTAYEVGDKVKKLVPQNETTTIVVGYICKTANSDSVFDNNKWLNQLSNMNYVEIVGNGTSSSGSISRSNARALDWDGNEYLKGDLYVNANTDSTGGQKVLVATDISGKADKTDTVLNTTLSRDRAPNTTAGTGSIAFGLYAEASGSTSVSFGATNKSTGSNSFSDGFGTTASGFASAAWGVSSTASGDRSVAEGFSSTASGVNAHAFGSATTASGENSITEGIATKATGFNAHAEGNGTKANGSNMHAAGAHNIEDTLYPNWVANTAYQVGDKVVGNYGKGYVCTVANQDATWTANHWTALPGTGPTVFVIGNGTTENATSNAFKIDWTGDVHTAGDIYVNANADSTGGTKLASINDVSDKADKTDTQLTTTLSRGRKANTTVGAASIAFGSNVEASSTLSVALGNGAKATGQIAYAEGVTTKSTGQVSHAEGDSAEASGNTSHAQGEYTIANGNTEFAAGKYNVADTLLPEWVSGSSYQVGDKVQRNSNGYECITANNDSSFTAAKWKALVGNSTEQTAFVVGNGSYGSRSNALRVDWDGNEYLMGDVYVHANANSANGVKVATTSDLTNKLGTSNIDTTSLTLTQDPETGEWMLGAKVEDVQVNGTSVVTNGVANIPKASDSALGVVKVANSYPRFGLEIVTTGTDAGKIKLVDTTDAQVKAGLYGYPVQTGKQHAAAFYGLAKAAGDDTQSASSNPVGTYTDAAKAAIQTMLGAQAAVEVVRLA